MGQRLEITSQSGSECKTSFFESQIRRRVWWQILWIDGRASQLAGQSLAVSDKLVTALPANLNDADIYPNMSELPLVDDRATEMIFCLTRYEVGVFLTENATKLHAADVEEKDELIKDFEHLLERRYLRYCDPAVPLHRLASGGARSAICKLKLVAHHHTTYHDKGKSMPQSEHDMIFATCVEMVELHALGCSSNDVERFSWHLHTAFQLDAVVLMLIESQTQPPTAPLTEKSWDLIAEVFKCHPDLMDDDKSGLHGAVRQLVLKAWRVRESAARRSGLALPPPSATINSLREMSRRIEYNRHGALEDLFTTARDRNFHIDTPMVKDMSQGIPDAVEAVDQDANHVDETLFPDWDLMDISSWDRWNELLQA